jgi:hypothetical protein
VPTPEDVLHLLLGSMAERHRPAPSVILQFWSKAGVDDGLRAVLNEQVGRLRDGIEGALRPWADQRSGGDGSVLAHQTASACMIIAQGFLANRGLFGWMDAEEYLQAVATAFGGQPDSPHR